MRKAGLVPGTAFSQQSQDRGLSGWHGARNNNGPEAKRGSPWRQRSVWRFWLHMRLLATCVVGGTRTAIGTGVHTGFLQSRGRREHSLQFWHHLVHVRIVHITVASVRPLFVQGRA